MNKEQKNILIVCFGFPPHPGIGGRRWAKFAKYLAKAGYKVHVIRNAVSENNLTEKSLWDKDIDHPDIYIYNLYCPEIRLISSSNLIVRALNRLKLIALSLLSAGSPYDPALLWSRGLYRKAAELVGKYDIQHVIATGAPFRVLYHMALFREKYPEIFLLCDYRDPWYAAHNYGMSSISSKRLAHEHAMEARVIKVADAITAPSDLFVGHPLREQIMAKFHQLQHAADPDDFEGVEMTAPLPETDGVVKIVYGGALYVGIEAALIRLGEILGAPQWTGPVVEIHLYSPDVGKLPWLSHLNPAVFRLHEAVASQVLFQKIVEASAAMIILAEHNKNFHTTKFFEISLLKKPIFFVGPNGLVSQKIEENKTGFILNNINKDLLLDIFNKIKIEKYKEYPIEENTFNFRTKELISFLHK